MFQTLSYEIIDRVASVKLIRENERNTITHKLLDELSEVTNLINKDETIVCAIITGTGKVFMAGADLKDIYRRQPNENMEFNHKIINTFNMIEKGQKPFIAVLNGFAFGGGLELALSCSIRVAAKGIKMGLPEVKLGMLPGAGGTQRLPRLIPRGKALKLMLSGETITSEQAAEWGIIDELVTHEELFEYSLDLAREIAANAPLAIFAMKQAVNEGLDLPVQDAICLTERKLGDLVNSDDFKEGIDAFLQKRKPMFKGV